MVDEHHPDLTRMASMAKCFASDVAMKVTTDTVQLLRGNGFTKDFPVERMFRRWRPSAGSFSRWSHSFWGGHSDPDSRTAEASSLAPGLEGAVCRIVGRRR